VSILFSCCGQHSAYSYLWTAQATKAPANSWLLCYCYL
jgi:hypothetical protein